MTKRFIRHPGPPLEPRVLTEVCSARRLAVSFQASGTVLESVAEALRAKRIDSAIIEIDQGVLAPLVYVIPAASPDDSHAAWYSDTRRPDGIGQIERLTMSFGWRQGEPFIHCHGIWRHADGFRGAGHLLPQESAFGDAVNATVYAISGAILDQQDDAETNFPLLTPVRSGAPRLGEARAVLLRIKPNTDVHKTLIDTARLHGIEDATIHGNLSFVGCDFKDGGFLNSYASEAFICNGRIESGIPSIEIGIVGMDGKVLIGEISPKGNIICIASELLIVEYN